MDTRDTKRRPGLIEFAPIAVPEGASIMKMAFVAVAALLAIAAIAH